MTSFEILSTAFSVLAFLLSGITAYRTFFAGFRSEIMIKPRVILSRLNKSPCIIIGCEISNQGVRAGSIDDLVLHVKHRQHNNSANSYGISTYTFLPILERDDYSVFKAYTDADFEPFQSISLAGNGHITKYIIFSPSNEKGFVLSTGQIELQLYSKDTRLQKWRKATKNVQVPVDDVSAKAWRDPKGRGVMLEILEHNRKREDLMEEIS